MPPVIGFVGAIISGITSAITAVSGLVGGFAGLSAFLTSPIGALVLGIGLQLILGPLLMRKPQVPSIEAGKVNVRVAEPERWLSAGRNRVGGGVLFAEFDGDGNFWYLIVHSDSILTKTLKRYFDDVEIELNPVNNDIITPDFCLNEDKDAYSPGDSSRNEYFRMWTTTYTETNPVPPVIPEFAAAFPGVWTSDHKLVGTTYSVVRVKSVATEHRYKVFKWRGPVGVGEPSVAIAGEWSNVYNPNLYQQILGKPQTYAFSTNAALIWAWFRTHRYGRNKPLDSINWQKVGEMATICAKNVIGIDGNHRMYDCAISIPESKERNDAEQEILASMDAQLVFDDDGRCWPRVGYYYPAQLKLTRNRDIVAMDSVEAQNGESETQGVIVRYIDPDFKYTAQPSAPWINPLYYRPGETPKYLTIDVLACQDHNQAMRIAKSIGMRSQAKYKILPTVGLRGLKARQERIVNINYDNVFAGEHEIVTPVEVDEVGIFCGFGLVPVDPDRWTLTSGEEKKKPVPAIVPENSAPELPSNVIVFYRNGRLEATFDPIERDDWRYDFEYKLSTETAWQDMAVKMDESFAYSGGVVQNKTYNIRWKTLASSGKATAYVTPVASILTQSLTLTGTPILTATRNVAYTSWTFGATGGESPYIFGDLYGRLPPGITINPATGVVSGTPTTAGTYANILLRAQDQNGAYNTRAAFTITVAP